MANAIILFSGILGFLSVWVQFYFSLIRRLAEGHSVLYGINYFFSYFTVIINISVSVLLMLSVLRPEARISRWFRKPVINTAFALYILVVGMIFYALLYRTSTAEGVEMLATHVLHGYVPVAYSLIWFYRYRTNTLVYSLTLKWILMPLAYFVYLLIRGLLLGVYPYFFVNPVKLGGYDKVALYAVAILAFFALLGSVLVFLDRRHKVTK